jgi:Na+-driven multidrug efflux pump
MNKTNHENKAFGFLVVGAILVLFPHFLTHVFLPAYVRTSSNEWAENLRYAGLLLFIWGVGQRVIESLKKFSN